MAYHPDLRVKTLVDSLHEAKEASYCFATGHRAVSNVPTPGALQYEFDLLRAKKIQENPWVKFKYLFTQQEKRMQEENIPSEKDRQSAREIQTLVRDLFDLNAVSRSIGLSALLNVVYDVFEHEGASKESLDKLVECVEKCIEDIGGTLIKK